MEFKITENPWYKKLESEGYNYAFSKITGFFARWGKTREDDPDFSPFGPEIVDLELSVGECSGRCAFCYKQNGNNSGEVSNMTLETFKKLVSKLPKTVTQIAFGICDIDTNPDFFEIMKYSKSLGIVPNYTCNGNKVTPEIAKKTAELCGAVAVSIVNKENSYNAIKQFTDAGMKQVNIHSMLSSQTYDKCLGIVDDMTSDPRLTKMNAIVFLQYKHKNPNSPFTSMVDKSKYRKLVEHCQSKKINFGFDSCSCGLFLESMEGHKDYEQFKTVSEPCESFGMFSSYINHKGIYFPCSFCEGVEEWKEGIDVLNCNDFVKDIWYHPLINKYRDLMIKNNRNCPMYKI